MLAGIVHGRHLDGDVVLVVVNNNVSAERRGEHHIRWRIVRLVNILAHSNKSLGIAYEYLAPTSPATGIAARSGIQQAVFFIVWHAHKPVVVAARGPLHVDARQPMVGADPYSFLLVLGNGSYIGMRQSVLSVDTIESVAVFIVHDDTLPGAYPHQPLMILVEGCHQGLVQPVQRLAALWKLAAPGVEYVEPRTCTYI